MFFIDNLLTGQISLKINGAHEKNNNSKLKNKVNMNNIADAYWPDETARKTNENASLLSWLILMKSFHRHKYDEDFWFFTSSSFIKSHPR